MINDLKNIKLVDATLKDYALALMSAESDSLKEVSLNVFFGNQKRETNDTELFDTYEHKKIQFVWKDFFETNEWTLVKEVCFGYLTELPPTMMGIEISIDKFMNIYKEAVVFFESSSGKKLCIEISQGPRGGFYYTFHTTEKNDKTFHELRKYADEKNLYKGQKIDCDCRFLRLDNISWDDVILSDGVDRVIKSNVNDLFALRDKLKKFELSVKRGVILHGPPGTGKTKIVKCLAKDADYSVLYALPSDFSPNSGGIKRICSMAKDLAPCLLIIEDIDWIAQSRSKGNGAFVIELMNYLDGIESFGDIITLGTTNCLEELEDAVKNRPGRFDRIIHIGNPTKESRKKMIQRFTMKFTIDKLVNIDKLADSLEELTGAHIFDLCNTAAMYAVRDDSIKKEKLFIQKKHFNEAIKEVKEKDYSNYIEQQSKKKIFGFSQSSQAVTLGDFLDDDDGSNW